MAEYVQPAYAIDHPEGCFHTVSYLFVYLIYTPEENKSLTYCALARSRTWIGSLGVSNSIR